MLNYLRGLGITLLACYKYVRYQIDDDEFEAEANKARTLTGQPPMTWCAKHHWQLKVTVPGVANEPTCVMCV